MEAKVLASWLAEISGKAVAVEDGAGLLVSASRALCRILGYEPGELVGKPWATLLAEQATEPDRSSSRYETLLSRKDGSPVPAQVTAWRLPTEGDPGQRYLSVFVMGKEGQRAEAPPGAEEPAALPDPRLASVAHELNNSLTALTLQSQLLSRLDAESSRFGEQLAILQEQVAHMKRIVAELQMPLDLSGRNFEATDVNALIRRSLEIQESPLQQAKVEVLTDLGSDLPQVQAEPHRLEQVFMNLIQNACQALTEADPPRLLWVSTRSIAGHNGHSPGIRISFANNGPAIPRDLLPRIFEPFFTTKEPHQGTGLGLTICARIVQEHRGQIWAESEAPNGALFVVELPANATAEAAPWLSPGASTPQSTQPRTPCPIAAGPYVLILDDEAEAVRPAEQFPR
jgi:PAS domain S-box-containing protein